LVFVATAGVALGCLFLADAASATTEKQGKDDGAKTSVVDASDDGIEAPTVMTIEASHALRNSGGIPCPSYGCPFLPLDVHYDEVTKAALEGMRERLAHDGTSEEGKEKKEDGEETAGPLLGSAGTDRAATLTLMGYKGGPAENQINQDRAFVITPYEFWNEEKDGDSSDTTPCPVFARLLGVFDGHAKFGEKVSEHAVTMLPKMVAQHLKCDEAAAAIQGILHDTFLEIDRSAPADPSGGCTASVVLQIDETAYIANAGDSRSFIVAHVVFDDDDAAGVEGGDNTTTVVYATREDKAELPDERARVEKMGGTVYVPPADRGGSSRVLYNDKYSGGRSGLAMSRSLGDWDAGKVGVVPDPIVDIVDLKEVRKGVVAEWNGAVEKSASCGGNGGAAAEVEIEATGEVKAAADGSSDGATSCRKITEDNVKVFAISATDGLLDFLPVDFIARHVAMGLYPSKKGSIPEVSNEGEAAQPPPANPLVACEELIYAAAHGWQTSKGGRYRDDIAIAVADLEIPSASRR